jgi:malonate transporter and related proteins
LKNILHPALMFAACLLFAVDGSLQHQIILLSALPTATITSMFANKQDVYESEATTAIFVGTVLSLIKFSSALTARLGNSSMLPVL